MFSRHLEVSLHLAMTLARQTSQEYLTVEHLLLALLENDNAVSALKACGADIPSLRSELIKYIKKNIPKVSNANQHVPQYTKGFDRVLQRAIHHVQAIGGGRLVEGSDILVAMFSEKDAYAVYLLKKQHISRLALTQYLSHGNQQDKDEDNEEIESNLETDKKVKKAKNPLTEFTVDLNQKAQEGKTDPLIGRALEIERTAQILCRRRKNNPLLVGDPGVGKTSIAEGLAWLIVNGKAPKPLAGSVIYSLDMGALIAGTKYRGDFEKRMKVLLDALKKRPNAILFIDEIHMIIGAGSSMNSNMDVSNLIKPALANGDLRCIGSTTFTEYRQVFEKDHALSRRFQKIDIKEPSIEDSIDILRGLKPHYESFHQVKYTDEALVCAVKLSAKYIHERFLPDKAIDVIDEAGAYKRLGLSINDNTTDKSSPSMQAVDLNKIGETQKHIEITDNDETKDDNETQDIEKIELSKHITAELKINPDMLTQDNSYMSETVKEMIRKRQLEDEISKGLIKDGGVVYDSLADLIRDVQEKDGDDEEEYIDDYDEESTHHQQNNHQNHQSAQNSTLTDKKATEKADDEQSPVIIIDVDDIENIIAKLARIPPKSVSNDDKSVLAYLDRDLKRLVFGQDEAISTLVDAIKLSRAGLKPLEKPIGSFMFAGPTGVGKTEVSRQLANLLGVELIRFDMSEYMEAHTASRLIGAPPGYVGFDQGGLLTEKINQYPHCVLLLDEIEKAHSDVFNLLLQVMDHGTLTDNNGRVASFKQVILIMTTNVGADSISRASIGFTEQDHSRDNGEALKRAFTPEFRNRLDAVIHFNPLDTEVIVSVVDKFLVELQAQLDDKQVVLEIDDEVRQYLAKKGYDRLMGARPMQRLIQNEIKKSLADMILFGDLVNGGTVKISLDNEQKIRLEVIESINSNKQPQQKMDC